MPKKIRELKAMLLKAGFDCKPGQGSHTRWRHSLLPEHPLTLSGKDGSDAKPYIEKEVEFRLRLLEERKQS
ncbi:MAG: type II toxin-antitoxin system HicA family toxin [Cyanobacteria bacterium P01_A01_bin.123]